MQVMIFDDAQAIGEYAASIILKQVAAGELKVLGVATGSSPLPIYEALAAGWIPELRNLTCFALDEYVGLPVEHPESYHQVVDREVTQRLKLDPARVHVPDGLADNLDVAAAEYDARIAAAGGVDLQILGIGATGHIGFNEPSSSFASRTRTKTLAPKTREDNARFFNSVDEVPRHSVTQGLGTIMDARQLVLVATGEGKADAVARAVEGPLSSMCPGSIIQWHQDALVLLDRAAASKLELIDYYEYVQAHEHEVAPR